MQAMTKGWSHPARCSGWWRPAFAENPEHVNLLGTLEEQLVGLVKLLPIYSAADDESASSYLALEGSQSLELQAEVAPPETSTAKAEPLSAKVRALATLLCPS